MAGGVSEARVFGSLTRSRLVAVTLKPGLERQNLPRSINVYNDTSRQDGGSKPQIAFYSSPPLLRFDKNFTRTIWLYGCPPYPRLKRSLLMDPGLNVNVGYIGFELKTYSSKFSLAMSASDPGLRVDLIEPAYRTSFQRRHNSSARQCRWVRLRSSLMPQALRVVISNKMLLLSVMPNTDSSLCQPCPTQC